MQFIFIRILKKFNAGYIVDRPNLLLTGFPNIHYGFIYGDKLGAVS